jgi:ribonucleoside-triphosphate reductase
VAETLPTMCTSVEEWLEACRHATLYTSTVSLLPTHQPSTNRVVARNRRIGVSIIDFSGWKHINGVHKITRYMRDGYKEVRKTNTWANQEAGIPLAIRVTTIKPGGTTPKLPGRTPGIGNPTFDYTLRRVRVAKNSPVHTILADAGIPYEGDLVDRYTDVFEYPILQGPAPPAEDITLWEQAMTLILVQREWADNAVSNTLYFRPMWQLIEVVNSEFHKQLESYIGITNVSSIFMREMKEFIVPERYRIVIKYKNGLPSKVSIYEFDPRHEERDIEPVLSMIAPHTKSVTMLPHSPKGAYHQMPEEGITETEYHHRRSRISTIDWSKLSGSDGIDERYCSGPVCEIVPPA